MCAHLVAVQMRDAAGTHEVIANLEDISPSGACIQLETAAAEGADIEIVCAQCRLKGRVRYCRFVGIGYDVGVAFDEPESWTRERFEPEHLLQLPELPARATRG
jgi:hypothetical protein